jgi:hypothetical protein
MITGNKGRAIMNKRLAQIYGVVIGLLALIGLFTEGQLWGLMNMDPALDGLRVILAAALLYVGFRDGHEREASVALTTVGVLCVGMGLLGMADSTLYGLLPSGLTGFDIAFHLVTGAIAAWAGLHKGSELRTAH